MTPLGHAAISHLASRTARFWLAPLVVLGGVLPDVDALLFFLPGFNEFHRTLTHSLVFALAASGLAALLSPKGKRLAGGASLLFGLALHFLVDSVMDGNPTNGIGILLWWPFSPLYFSPFNLTPAEGPVAGWGDLTGSLMRAGRGMLWEAPFILASGWLIVQKRLKRIRRSL